jgi:hypothetical protein
MHFSANESIARQRIADLYAEAEMRRRIRAHPVGPRHLPVGPRHLRGVHAAVREALGYRLIVLGWRLLDTNPRLAHPPGTR